MIKASVQLLARGTNICIFCINILYFAVVACVSYLDYRRLIPNTIESKACLNKVASSHRSQFVGDYLTPLTNIKNDWFPKAVQQTENSFQRGLVD